MKREWILKCILGFFALFFIGTIVKYHAEKVLAEGNYPRKVVEIRPGVTVVPGVTIVPEMIQEIQVSPEEQDENVFLQTENEEKERTTRKEMDGAESVEVRDEDLAENANTEPEVTDIVEAKDAEAEAEKNEESGVYEETPEDGSSEEDSEEADTLEEKEKGEADQEEYGEKMEEHEKDIEKDPEKTENDEDNHSEEEKRPDLFVVLKTEAEESKAGRELSYEIILSNTGEKNLSNLTMLSIFSREDVSPIWKKNETITVDEQTNEACLKELKAGETAHIFFSAFIPEDMTIPLENSLTVTAKDPETEKWLVRRDAEICTTILPLSIDYEVEKIADRGVAYPGNVVTYTIMIRNTGERTLHSVVSAEHFLNEGIKAQFLYQEGILLNTDRTQAYIAELAPGKTASLKASVTIPEGMIGENLINQVYVYTEETGNAFIQSEASVEIKAPEPSPTAIPEITEAVEQPPALSTYAASAVQTGDSTPVSRWIRIAGASLLLIFLLYLAKHCRTDRE